MTRFSKILVFCFLLLACSREKYAPDGRTVFRYNESSGITSLDPAFSSNQANIWAVNQLFNGLVSLDDELRIQPCIAKSWTISKDGRQYTFLLRDDVYFHASEIFPGHKGRKVKAKDFVFSFNRIIDRKIASPGAWVFGKVAVKEGKFAFEALNDSTLSITLKEQFPPFLGLMSMQYCSVVPKEATAHFGADFRRNPVGTGPFQFATWKEGVKLVLLKNDNYFEFSGNDRLPYLDAVAVTFIVDKQAAFLEFIKGNLDFMSGIDAGYKDELLTSYGELNPRYKDLVNLQKSSYLNTEYLGVQMDTSRFSFAENPLRMRKIRQALSYGFDRVKMMRYLRNSIGRPALHGFIPSGFPYYDQNKVKGYTYDPLKARQLLAGAGFPGGKGLPPVTLTTNASYLDLCRFIHSQLNELGFDIQIDVVPPATLKEMMAQAKVPFFRGSWIADYPDAENYLSLFITANHAPAGPNYTRFTTADLDRLYARAAVEVNDSLRAQLYMQMDNLLMQEAPVVVLFYDEVLRFTRKPVQGLGCNAMNLLTLKNVRKSND